MSMTTPIENCFHQLRNVFVPRKLFFVTLLVQFTLFVLMIVYSRSGLYMKGGRYNTEWAKRYSIKTRTQVVSSSIGTTASLTTNTTPLRNVAVLYVSRESRPNITIPNCPLVPPYLQGKISVDMTEYDEKHLSLKHPFVRKGGFYKPKTCRPRHRVAVIIPYRNRKSHLRIFLNNLHPFLQKQQLDYRIFVIELAPDVDFNRALCMNIGYLEAMKKFGFKCFIFHDVDLIPENDNNMYSCPENPRHMSVAIDKYDYQLQYVGIFGGVSAMSKDQFELVNGYSIKYFGWGGEDDDLYSRIRNLGVSITRYTPDVGSYRMLKHQVDLNRNTNRFQFLNISLVRWRKDGLNTIKYEVIQTVQKRLYTYILADIDPNDIVYQPWTMGRGNESRDNSLDPIVEEVLLDRARTILNKFSLDRGFVDNLKREFRFLNTSDVTMQNVAGIIRKLLPAKSPVPMDVPKVIESSGKDSGMNLQTRVTYNGSGSYLHALLKTQVTVEHSQTQNDDPKSLQIVQTPPVNRNSFTSGPIWHQHHKMVYREQEHTKQVQTQPDNHNYVTQLKTQQEKQIPAQSVQTQIKTLNPNNFVKVQHENSNSVKPKQTQYNKQNLVNSVKIQEEHNNPVVVVKARDQNQNPANFVQNQNQNPANFVQNQNQNPANFVQNQNQNPVYTSNSVHRAHAQEKNKNFENSAQKQKKPILVNFDQVHQENQDKMQTFYKSVITQLGNPNSKLFINTRKEIPSPFNSVQIQQKITTPSNPLLTHQENKIQKDMENERVHLQPRNKEQLNYVPTQTQTKGQQSRTGNADVDRPLIDNKQFQNIQQLEKRFEGNKKIPEGWKEIEMFIRKAQKSKPVLSLKGNN